MRRRLVVEGSDLVCDGRLVRICRLAAPWYETVRDPKALVQALKRLRPRPDLLSFFQRVPRVDPEYDYYAERYSVAVLRLGSYDEWWTTSIGKKMRRSVRHAHGKGIIVRETAFDDDLVAGIHEVYNETPMRQGKKFPHYGDSLDRARSENMTYLERSQFLAAYWQDEFVGFAKIVYEEEFTDILQLLAKVAHRDKNVTSALVARIVEACASRGVTYVAYGDWDTGTLTDFKRHCGFTRMDLPMFYIPVTPWGALVLKFGLHRPLKRLVPPQAAQVGRKLRAWWYKKRPGE
jgi:GNAT superfamily N-acetyltransferase